MGDWRLKMSEAPKESIKAGMSRLGRDIIEFEEQLNRVRAIAMDDENLQGNLEASTQVLTDAVYILAFLVNLRIKTLAVQEDSEAYGLAIPRRDLLKDVDKMAVYYRSMNYSLGQRVDALKKLYYDRGRSFDLEKILQEVRTGFEEMREVLRENNP